MTSDLYRISATNFMRYNYSEMYHFALESVYNDLPSEIEAYQKEAIRLAEKAYNEQKITYQHFLNITRAVYALDGSYNTYDELETALTGSSISESSFKTRTPIFKLVRKCSEENNHEIPSLEPSFIICEHKLTNDEMIEEIINKDMKPLNSIYYEACNNKEIINVIMLKRSEFLSFVRSELRHHRWFKHSNVNRHSITNDECITDFIKCGIGVSSKNNCLGNNIIKQLKDDKEYILIKLCAGKNYGTAEFVNEW